jgi:hypothetical protein
MTLDIHSDQARAMGLRLRPAGEMVDVYSPEGRRLGQIEVPSGKVDLTPELTRLLRRVQIANIRRLRDVIEAARGRTFAELAAVHHTVQRRAWNGNIMTRSVVMSALGGGVRY